MLLRDELQAMLPKPMTGGSTSKEDPMLNIDNLGAFFASYMQMKMPPGFSPDETQQPLVEPLLSDFSHSEENYSGFYEYSETSRSTLSNSEAGGIHHSNFEKQDWTLEPHAPRAYAQSQLSAPTKKPGQKQKSNQQNNLEFFAFKQVEQILRDDTPPKKKVATTNPITNSCVADQQFSFEGFQIRGKASDLDSNLTASQTQKPKKKPLKVSSTPVNFDLEKGSTLSKIFGTGNEEDCYGFFLMDEDRSLRNKDQLAESYKDYGIEPSYMGFKLI